MQHLSYNKFNYTCDKLMLIIKSRRLTTQEEISLAEEQASFRRCSTPVYHNYVQNAYHNVINWQTIRQKFTTNSQNSQLLRSPENTTGHHKKAQNRRIDSSDILKFRSGTGVHKVGFDINVGKIIMLAIVMPLQARIQLLDKGEVAKIMENNFFAASSKCQRSHATKTSSATSSYELQWIYYRQ